MLSDRLSVCLSVLSVLFVTLVYCGQTVGWIKMKLGTEVGRGPGHIVLDGDPAPLSIGHSPTLFGPCLLWPKDRPSQLLLSTCMFSHVSVISVKINIWSYLRTYCSVL